MIVMLDTSQDLRIASAELGCPVEQLLTPLTRFSPQYPEECFAIDNGAFSHFDKNAFLSLLQREEDRKSLCRFVAAPDVVGSARRTLEAFEFWYGRLCGWPLALVAQDGLEDFDLPWGDIDAIFIGGTTQWKLGIFAEQIIKSAQIMEKWVHVGRVNTPARYEHFRDLGANSIDGTGLSQYSWMRNEIYHSIQSPKLFEMPIERG